MKTYFILILLFSLFSTSCEKVERISKIELFKMAKAIDPSVTYILPRDLKSGVRCIGVEGELYYGEGCIGAFKVQVGVLDLTVLEFSTPELAKREANRIKQFYFKNWVFDEVSNEPMLEHFVKKAFNAQKARP